MLWVDTLSGVSFFLQYYDNNNFSNWKIKVYLHYQIRNDMKQGLLIQLIEWTPFIIITGLSIMASCLFIMYIERDNTKDDK